MRPPPIRKGGPPRPTQAKLAREEAQRRADAGDWEGSTGATLVGLYCHCHDLVYGVAPLELEPAQAFQAAQRSAATMLRDQFGGDADAAVDFVRWAWEREQAAVRRDTNPSRRRLGWRLQFSLSLLTDYQVAMARRQQAGR